MKSGKQVNKKINKTKGVNVEEIEKKTSDEARKWIKLNRLHKEKPNEARMFQ